MLSSQAAMTEHRSGMAGAANSQRKLVAGPAAMNAGDGAIAITAAEHRAPESVDNGVVGFFDRV